MVSTPQHLQFNMLCKIKCFLKTGSMLLEMTMLLSVITPFFFYIQINFSLFQKTAWLRDRFYFLSFNKS